MSPNAIVSASDLVSDRVQKLAKGHWIELSPLKVPFDSGYRYLFEEGHLLFSTVF